MKTFKWTIPELPLSAIEVEQHRLRGECLPLMRCDVLFHRKWAVIHKRGRLSFRLRQLRDNFIAFVVFGAAMWIWLGPEVWRMILAGFVGGSIGILIGEGSLWRRNEARFLSIDNQIEKQSEQRHDPKDSSFL